jgi:hypothetical protein
MVELMTVATRKRTKAFKALNEGLRPSHRTHPSPDFTDEIMFADGARIRDRLNAMDLDASDRADLELDEREHALKYWGF